MHGTPEFPPLSEGSEGRAAENPSSIPNVSKVCQNAHHLTTQFWDVLG